MSVAPTELCGALGYGTKRDVEGAVPYAKLYVCRGDHWSPDEKQIIDKRE